MFVALATEWEGKMEAAEAFLAAVAMIALVRGVVGSCPLPFTSHTASSHTSPKSRAILYVLLAALKHSRWVGRGEARSDRVLRLCEFSSDGDSWRRTAEGGDLGKQHTMLPCTLHTLLLCVHSSRQDSHPRSCQSSVDTVLV